MTLSHPLRAGLWPLALAAILAAAAPSRAAGQVPGPGSRPVDRSGREQPDEVPCSVVRSAAHGVLLIGARARRVGGPACDLMGEYGDWLLRTDSLLGTPPSRRPRRFTGREWDYASGAMRIGVPSAFVLLRGDSVSFADARGTRRLYLTAIAGDGGSAPEEVGSWHVLVDQDSSALRLFRSAITERGLRVVLSGKWGVAWATRNVTVDPRRVRSQLDAAARLRAALGFEDRMPPVQFIIGPPTDTTLAMLGVAARGRALYAMMVHPPLAVFAPRAADGGIDAHELVHVATMGRRGVVPGAVGEAYAMHAGGSHGRRFAEAFCASEVFDSLPPLGAAELDSAMAGLWWNDARADIAGFALGHAIGWFIATRGDSAWIFADGERAASEDALGFLAGRAGMVRDLALIEVTRSFAARRASCPAGGRPAGPSASRPSAAPAAPPPPNR